MAAAQLRRYTTAIDELTAAVSLAPNQPRVHTIFASVLIRSHRYELAEREAREAIRLEPTEAGNYGALGAALLGRERWREALSAFDRALAIDPSSGFLEGRALCLAHLDRLEEARSASALSLAAEPGSSFAHAVHAYLALHDGQINESVTAFRESLRLDPTNSFALGWIQQAAFGRSRAYRLVQSYQLASRRSRKASGVLLVVRFIPGVNLLVIVWALWSWVATPLVTLGMVRDPLARLILRRIDIAQGLAVAGLLTGAVGAALLEIATGTWIWGVAATACFLLAFPVAQVLRMSPGWPRDVILVWSGIVGVLGLIATLLTLTGPPVGTRQGGVTALIGLAFVAVLVLFFVANRLARVVPPLSGD